MNPWPKDNRVRPSTTRRTEKHVAPKSSMTGTRTSPDHADTIPKAMLGPATPAASRRGDTLGAPDAIDPDESSDIDASVGSADGCTAWPSRRTVGSTRSSDTFE